jgi:hypothetical protein
MAITSSMSAVVIGRKRRLPSEAKKPQLRSASCGFCTDPDFVFISLSMAVLPASRLGLHEQYLKLFVGKLMREAGKPLLKWNDGGEFRREGAYAG